MTVLESYLTTLTALRGATVPETAYYAILQTLLDEAGEALRSQVKAVIHPKASGAGIPDLALFDENQTTDTLPAHGIVEAKPVSADLLAIAKGEQVARYVAHYGQALAKMLDAETPVEHITAGEISAALQGEAVLTTVNGGVPDFTVNVGWGHYGAGSAVMPGRGRIVPTEPPPQPSPVYRGGSENPQPDIAYDVYLNETTYWRNVPEAVWEYTLGGYQVLKKWLSYRETAVLGRPLKPEEAREFMHIARRIAGLLALNPALDTNYRAVVR